MRAIQINKSTKNNYFLQCHDSPYRHDKHIKHIITNKDSICAVIQIESLFVMIFCFFIRFRYSYP